MSSNEEKRNPYEGVGKAAWAKRQLIQEDYPGNLYKEAYGDFETILNEDQTKALLVAMCFLEPRQKMILEMRYRDKMSFSEIGKVIGVTTERVRQIEHKAMRGLRTPRQHKIVTKGFEGYLHDVCEYQRKQGYDRGYMDGYYQGVKDANEGKTKPGVSVNIVELPVEALSLSVGAVQCLRNAGIEKIAELLVLDEKNIKHVPKLWTRRRQEIATGLNHYQICNEVWEYYLPYEEKYGIMKENDK